MAPKTRAELVNQLAAAGLPVSRRPASSAPSGCRRWPALRRSSRGSSAETARSTPVSRSTSRATTGYARPVSTRCASRSPPPRVSASGTRTPPSDEARRSRGEGPRAGARRRPALDGDHQRRLRLPVRGARRSGDGGRARRAAARGGRGRPRRHDRRRNAGPGTLARRARRKARAPISTTRATPASRTRMPRSKAGRRRSTRRSAGSAAVPSPRAQPATSRPRASSTCSRATESRPGSTWTR